MIVEYIANCECWINCIEHIVLYGNGYLNMPDSCKEGVFLSFCCSATFFYLFFIIAIHLFIFIRILLSPFSNCLAS